MRVPEDLKRQVEKEVSLDAVRCWACHDLGDEGRYIEGWVALTDDRLGHFLRHDGQWSARWIDVSTLDNAPMVEGLGMSVLRVLAHDTIVGQWRFTKRHEKEMAQLHRLLERRLTGKEEEAETGRPRGDTEKKLRCESCGRVIPPWAEVCPACLSKRKLLFRLLAFVRPYKWRAIVGATMALSMTGLSLIQPGLTKPMVDQGLGGNHLTPDWSLFLRYSLLLTGLIVITAIGRGVESRMMAGLGSRVARSVRDAAYAHLHKLSLSFFSQKQTGSLVTRVTTDSDRLWDFVASTVVEVSVSFLTIAGVGVALFVMNWRLACFVLLPVPLMLVMMFVFHRRMHKFFHRIMHRWSQMTSVVADALPGVRVIKAFSQEGREVDRFAHRNEQVYNQEMGMVNTWTAFGPVMQLCSQIGVLVIWLLGGWWVVRDYPPTPGSGAMTVGTLMAFQAYMMMFYRPIHSIAHMDRMFTRAAASAQRIFEILDTAPTVFSKSGAVRAEELRGEIELRNVTFSYDGVRRVLKNVSLHIHPGEMIGLAGPSGGGKTTLVNLICRFYDVLEGSILIDGVDVRDYEVHDLRRQIGVVLQEPFLFHGAVAQNIAYGNPEVSLEEIIRAARAANAHDFIVGFPDGYDTMVGERGQTLSGGERQRISIARAILHDPKILILDEATSSVDTESEKLIQEAIARLVRDRTTIAIAHRLSTLQRADRLVILDKGAVVETGTHDELAAKGDGLYAKLLTMQTEAKSLVALGG